MGFWDWLTGGPKGVAVVDRIWLNQEAKFRGLCNEIQEQLHASPVIVAAAHFPETLNRLRTELTKRNLANRDQANSLSPAGFFREVKGDNPPTVILVQARALVPDEFPAPLVDETRSVSILVAERHFLRSHDDRVVDFARGLGSRCRLSFHLSLEDPLMRIFAGEWVGQMLRNLGMTDSQPIESAMVNRRIKGAQAKFAKKVKDEQKADSAEQWLQSNVP
jgi:preprotein translocase subunit SecA